MRSVFIPIPKKVVTMDCVEHRTISLMSHVIKVVLRIILHRWWSKIRSEIAEIQCGFVEDKGSANAIFIVRNIVKGELEMQNDVCACFIDYTKVFDKLRHENIVPVLGDLRFNGKDIRLVWIYTEIKQ